MRVVVVRVRVWIGVKICQGKRCRDVEIYLNIVDRSMTKQLPLVTAMNHYSLLKKLFKQFSYRPAAVNAFMYLIILQWWWFPIQYPFFSPASKKLNVAATIPLFLTLIDFMKRLEIVRLCLNLCVVVFQRVGYCWLKNIKNI